MNISYESINIVGIRITLRETGVRKLELRLPMKLRRNEKGFRAKKNVTGRMLITVTPISKTTSMNLGKTRTIKKVKAVVALNPAVIVKYQRTWTRSI